MSPPANQPEVAPLRARSVALLWGVLAAVLLSVIFWKLLWTGGGLVGSDIYAYYLPQKAFYAERLRAGELPLWNNLVGNGYPQVAESQTGVFYPLHLVLYPFLELNAAYSASVIVHYVLAFLFTALYARRIGLSRLGAGLAALVYTYGWFPPRVCLEWSIIGGTWLPLALWSAETFLRTRFWRYAFLLTATLAMQMLAGHFLLAFITQLTVTAYVPLRLWFSPGDLPPATRGSRGGACLGLGLAFLAAFLIAAVQLLPTWELKHLSQRAGVTDEHDPAFGVIPLKYLSQVALPWVWYPDEAAFQEAGGRGGPRTNRVEAHLYFGLIPLVLLLRGIWECWRKRDFRLGLWIILGFVALLVTPGWLLPVTKHLPGFSYFEGPGRYGIITTLAAGLLAGAGFDSIVDALRAFCGFWRLPRLVSSTVGIMFALGVFGGTVADLYLVSRMVTYAVQVPTPPTRFLAESPLRRVLSGIQQPVRIFSDGKNLPSLLGVATLPTYLGLGPAQYFDPEYALPQPWSLAVPPAQAQLDWFHRQGVTHCLSFTPLDLRAWSAGLVWEGADTFLNAAMGRHDAERVFLYELEGSRGRAAFRDMKPRQSAEVIEYQTQRVVVDADSEAGGRLILTDLTYPGWDVTVDGIPAESRIVEGMFRGVDLTPGKHTVAWTYRPATLYWGAAISGSTVLILLALAHVRYWHPQVFRKEPD